jgi:hypothetical protein
MYLCSKRAGLAADSSHACSGGAFAVRASEVDQDIWQRVQEIIRDRDKFQRLTQGKTQKLEQDHQEAVRRAETVARELADFREKQAMVCEAMTYLSCWPTGSTTVWKLQSVAPVPASRA